MKVKIRRQWNDWHIAEVDFTKLSNIAWDRYSDRVNVAAPQYFIHAYIWCDEYDDHELAHSCQHGKGPHNIKICITKTGNEPVYLSCIENDNCNSSFSSYIVSIKRLQDLACVN